MTTNYQTVTFNTGRQYSAEGQPISAAFDPETGTIAFVDFGRLIEGVIRNRTKITKALVMAAYDAGAYEMPSARDMPLINAARIAA